MESTDAKPYLDYLEKEMTIMGVLSAFCVGLVVLVVERLASADQHSVLTEVWKNHSPALIAGCCFALVAALFFYRQRSLLAWYYGQIALCLAGKNPTDRGLSGLLDDADSWKSWYHYQIGFVLLVPTLIFITAALARVHLGFVAITVISLLAVAAAVAVRKLLLRFWDEPEPYRQLWSSRGKSPGKRTA